MQQKKSPKLLLIGWDSADWKVINPLLESGQMPVLDSLINGGAMGNLATLDPPLSPILWTSIATGKYAFKHGVHGFLEGCEQNTKIRPVTNASIKTKTVWKILNENGFKTNVVGWWPSHPAEQLDGVQVSNFYGKSKKEDDEDNWALAESCISEPSLYETLKNARIHPSEFTREQLMPFVPDFLKANDNQKKLCNILLNDLAECLSIHSASTYLAENTDWDFMAVYYNAIDHISHIFMKYHPPHLDWVKEDDFQLFKEVVNGFYKYHDMMLGRWLELVGEDAYVMVLSDHGFHSDHLRKKELPKEPAAIAREHNHFGMLVIKGPNIKKDERIYGASLIDITPTILSIFDLPVGQDMDGRVLQDIYDSPKNIQTIRSFDEETYQQNLNDFKTIESDEMLQQLVDLGYVDAPEIDNPNQIKRLLDENNFYLARSYVDARKFHEAITIMEKLVSDYPKNHRYLIKLAQLYLQIYDAEKLAQALEKLTALIGEKSIAVRMLYGKLAYLQNDFKKALSYFDVIDKDETNSDYIQFQLGSTYLKLGKHHKAIKAFEKNLVFDASNYNALHGIGTAWYELGNYENAIQYLLDSLTLVHFNPGAHFQLGLALKKVGAIQEAAQAFEIAFRMAPDLLKAKEALIEIFTHDLPNPEKLNSLLAAKIGVNRPTKIIVSGMPRSGTSMMMQMLEAGGLQPFTDQIRQADEDNRKGYYEHEAIKRLAKDNGIIEQVNGKVVKVIASLLKFLPDKYNYKIIYMERDFNEIALSQEKMLERSKAIPKETSIFQLSDKLKAAQNKVETWLENKKNFEVLKLQYQSIVEDPKRNAEKIADFLKVELHIEQMIDKVDQRLYRNKV
jgi:predicted AlkP superfamily phosphohydrolase/phosphomutase/Flp pilus assembly protein TadD